MNIKTLEYIHTLLESDLEEKEKAFKEFEPIWRATYNSETDTYSEESEEQYAKLRSEYLTAIEMIKNFEKRDW